MDSLRASSPQNGSGAEPIGRGRDVDLLSAPDGNYIEPAGTTRDQSNIPMIPQNSS
jgi:hypothetical protein